MGNKHICNGWRLYDLELLYMLLTKQLSKSEINTICV